MSKRRIKRLPKRSEKNGSLDMDRWLLKKQPETQEEFYDWAFKCRDQADSFERLLHIIRDTNPMSLISEPSASTNAAFACELYLKAMLYGEGTNILGHNLWSLYQELSQELRDEIRNLHPKSNTPPERWNVELLGIGEAFETMRYRYEKTGMYGYNVAFLYELMETLHFMTRGEPKVENEDYNNCLKDLKELLEKINLFLEKHPNDELANILLKIVTDKIDKLRNRDDGDSAGTYGDLEFSVNQSIDALMTSKEEEISSYINKNQVNQNLDELRTKNGNLFSLLNFLIFLLSGIFEILLEKDISYDNSKNEVVDKDFNFDFEEREVPVDEIELPKEENEEESNIGQDSEVEKDEDEMELC